MCEVINQINQCTVQWDVSDCSTYFTCYLYAYVRMLCIHTYVVLRIYLAGMYPQWLKVVITQATTSSLMVCY